MLRVLPIALAIVGFSACFDAQQDRRREAIQPTYEMTTGRLTQLAYDSDENGRVDTWMDMDGARPLGARVDRNEDGKIDRWERYDVQGRLTKVGFSRSDNGTADAWAFSGPDNRVERVEISSVGDERRIDRWEYYDPARAGFNGRGALIRAEEDTDGDGKPDKWETYEDGTVKSVAFDEDGDQVPDRRLTYQGSGLASIESQPDASGRFTRRAEIKSRSEVP